MGFKGTCTSMFGVVTGLLLISISALAQQPPPKTVSDSVLYIWKDISKDFIDLAEAMPADKWSFKPTQGEFSKARTFGEQVKHVACANEAWAKQILNQKPPERCDLGGPNPAKTKAEIMEYLRESFAMVDKVINDTTAANLLDANTGPYWGPNRLSAITANVWHTSDHYGQLVLYLRMNGIVPPASR